MPRGQHPQQGFQERGREERAVLKNSLKVEAVNTAASFCALSSLWTADEVPGHTMYVVTSLLTLFFFFFVLWDGSSNGPCFTVMSIGQEIQPRP